MNKRNFRRTLGKGSLALVAASVALPVLLIVIVGFDDALSASARRYQAVWPGPLPTVAENGFYAFAGLLRSAGEDPHTFGQQWYAKLSSEKPEDESILTAWQKEEIKSGNAQSWSCGRAHQAKRSCVDTILAKRADIEAASIEHALVVARFEQLFQYALLIEPYASPSFTAPLPHYPGFAMHLSQARSVLAFAGGRYEEALRTIEARWRLALKLEAGAATLITKMMGIARLREEQALLSEMLALGRPGFNVHAARIAALLAEYDTHAHGFTRVWHNECRMQSVTLANLDNPGWRGVNLVGPESPSWIDRVTTRAWLLMTYRAQRSMNESAKWCDEMIRMSALSPAQALAEFDARQKRDEGIRWWSWVFLRNPAGHMLVHIAQPNYGTYVARSFDLQGSNRLVRLQAAVASGEAPTAAAARYELRDPYTGSPLNYDPLRRVAAFTQRQTPYSGEAASLRIEVPLLR